MARKWSDLRCPELGENCIGNKCAWWNFGEGDTHQYDGMCSVVDTPAWLSIIKKFIEREVKKAEDGEKK